MTFFPAADADAAAIAALRTAAAERLTLDFGYGLWSSCTTEKRVLRDLKGCRVFVVRSGGDLVATVTLATKKPWAIDPAYFTPVRKPIYVLSMAVAPAAQRQCIGRGVIEEAKTIARAWPADAIRLDAHDAEAGAAPFYAKCGFREVGRLVYRKTPLVYFESLL